MANLSLSRSNGERRSVLRDIATNNPVSQRFSMIKGLFRQVRIAWRLLFDSRVPVWLKAIPLLAVGYVLTPVDFLPELLTGPLGFFDDLTILVMAFTWFIQNSPQDVISEHARVLGFLPEDYVATDYADYEEEN